MSEAANVSKTKMTVIELNMELCDLQSDESKMWLSIGLPGKPSVAYCQPEDAIQTSLQA